MAPKASNRNGTANIGFETKLWIAGGHVAVPGQLFYSTQIPVCLWLLAKNKEDCEHAPANLALAA